MCLACSHGHPRLCGRDPRWALAVAVHQVLYANADVTNGLEDTAELEGPGNGRFRGKEPEHLHRIANEPVDEDGEAETFTRTSLGVGVQLR